MASPKRARRKKKYMNRPHSTPLQSKNASLSKATHRPVVGGCSSPRQSLYSEDRQKTTVVDFSPFDADYVRRLTDGDAETEKHFDKHFRPLLRIKLRRRTRNSHLADEIIQEVFFRVFRQLRERGGLNDPERLGAFVHGVCNNVLLEKFRQENRYLLTDDRDDEHTPRPEVSDVRPGPGQRYDATEIRSYIERTLDELPERDRQIIRAVFVEERDREEVQSEFQVTSQHLRVLVHRARNRFREQYLRLTGAGAA